jgi:hypothetical protein
MSCCHFVQENYQTAYCLWFKKRSQKIEISKIQNKMGADNSVRQKAISAIVIKFSSLPISKGIKELQDGRR